MDAKLGTKTYPKMHTKMDPQMDAQMGPKMSSEIDAKTGTPNGPQNELEKTTLNLQPKWRVRPSLRGGTESARLCSSCQIILKEMLLRFPLCL